MEKYLIFFVEFLCFLGVPIVMGFGNISDGIEDKSLNNCIVSIVQKWSLNMTFPEIALMNVDHDIDISELHKVKGLKFISRTFSSTTNRVYNNAYIIGSQNYSELRIGLNKATKDNLWNPMARFLIIVKNLEHNDLVDIRNLLFQHNMYDIIFITHRNKDYAIYQLKTKSKSYCRRSDTLVLVSWCTEYLNKQSLSVIRRKESIRNCRFKFITHKIWPFINTDNTQIEGIEQRILKDFEKYEGVKIGLQLMRNETDKYGDAIPGYVEHMLKQVNDNEFEGTVGGHTIVLNNSKDLSYTYPVMIGRKVIVLSHANYLHPWELVLRIPYFAIGVLVIFVILCVTASLLSIFPTSGRDVTRDILIVLGYILNKTGVNNIHPKLPQRLVFYSLLWLALLLPYTIQGYLYGSITNPVRGFEPKTMKELPGYTLIVYTELTYRYLASKNKCGSRLNCLLQVKNSETKSLFTVVSLIYFLAYSSHLTDDQCKKSLYSMKEAFNIEFRTFFLRRGSVLSAPLNKVKLRIASAGLIDKYYKDIYDYEDLKCKYREKLDQIPMGLYDIYGPFIILIVGYMISLITFTWEIILGLKKG